MEKLPGAQEALLPLLLPLLLPFNRLTSLPRALGSGFPHLQLPDVSGHALTALGLKLLTLSCLRKLLARNNRLGRPGSLPKGLAQSPLCRSLQVLTLSDNCFQELPASLMELCFGPSAWAATSGRASPPRSRTCRV